MGILTDNTFRLATKRRNDGRVGRLRFEWDGMRNSVKFSGQTAAGEWINAYLMLSEFSALCHHVRKLVNSKEEMVYACEVEAKNAYAYTISVGRDSDGLLYLSLDAPQRDTTTFFFLPERQYKWSCNGQPLPTNELSRLNALQWVENSLVIMQDRAAKVVPTDNKSFGGNGGQGGGGFQKKPWQGNNNGGGYQKKPWQGNGGGQGGGYQKKPWQGNNQQGQQQQNDNSQPMAEGSYDEYLTL